MLHGRTYEGHRVVTTDRALTRMKMEGPDRWGGKIFTQKQKLCGLARSALTEE